MNLYKPKFKDMPGYPLWPVYILEGIEYLPWRQPESKWAFFTRKFMPPPRQEVKFRVLGQKYIGGNESEVDSNVVTWEELSMYRSWYESRTTA